MQRPMLDALDAWATSQDDKPGRPEAIRRLVNDALAKNYGKRAASG